MKSDPQYDEEDVLELGTRPRVRQLSDELSNQIAAGEVVERPSSVVKELVENSVDAGATRIDIELEEGGANLIRIRDDGCGMDRSDAELAIRRHATSKIRRREDLFAIASMGFRGEALPSIASVSRFSLVSKPHGTLGGTRILVDGGNLKLIEEFGCPSGTEIVVKDLFFNTPARRKFMKTRSTEMKHAVEAVHRLAIPRPEIAFTLEHNGRTVLDLPAVENHADRLFSIFGKEDSDALYRTTQTEQDGVHAWGFAGSPTISRRNSTGIWTFVNGRYIRDSSLMAAVKVAYRGMMERGRQPVAVVFLDVPLADVDVNVHPTKVEVRFNDASAVFRATRRTIIQTLSDTPWVPPGERRPHAEGSIDDSDGADFARRDERTDGAYNIETTAERVYSLRDGPVERPEVTVGGFEIDDAGAAGLNLRGGQSVGVGYTQKFGRDGGTRNPRSRFSEELRPFDEELPAGYFESLQFVGQIHGTYLLCSDQRGLVVVDMHAAHERITFESLRRAWGQRHIEIQQIMFPDVLSLDSLRGAVLEEHLHVFERLGFDIESLGGSDYALRAVPAILQSGNLKSLIRDALDELGEHGESDRVDEAMDAILIRMACHGSLRSGDTVHPDEAYELFKQLDAVEFGANCPHGRPVFFQMSVGELESRFSRR